LEPLTTKMNSNQQESGAPRVSILVDAGGVEGSSPTTGQNDSERGAMSPGSVDIIANEISGPTAIPVDEGDVSKVGVDTTVGLESGADVVDTVTPREGDAVNVTNDANVDDQEEDDGEGENQGEDIEDDESEYSYNYDDEDEGHFSGFLIPTEPIETGNNVSSNSLAAAASSAGGNDNVNVVASEDSAVGANAAMGSGGGGHTRTISRVASGSASPIPEAHPQESERKQKWREPTRAAVNMSLRAEKEKTGGRRRLASDLYKIMMADTKEAGFSLEPCDEDSMDKWCIKLFDFDEDSNLAKDLMVCGMDHVQLEMGFPDQYPFAPPSVRVVTPRFRARTGFVMSGALCMELLTNDGWNPINDIESVIVSIRSLMVVGDGRLQATADMGREAYKKAVETMSKKKKAELKEGKMPEDEADDSEDDDTKAGAAKRKRAPSIDGIVIPKGSDASKKVTGGSYSAAEAQSAYDHLSKYHKKEGWDKSGWWGRVG